MLLRAAGYRRRALLVGSGAHIEAVAHALHERHAEPGRARRLHLAHAAARQRPALARARSRDLPRCSTAHRVQEVIIADPDFPQEHAVELVDRCHQRGVTVRIAPSTMEILMHRAEFVPGSSVPLFELRPPVFDGFDFALKRSFDFVVSRAAARRPARRCSRSSRSPSRSPRAGR